MPFNRQFLKIETLGHLCNRLGRQVIVTATQGVWQASVPRLSYPIGSELSKYPLGIGHSAEQATTQLCELMSNKVLRLDEGLPTARSITIGTVYVDALADEVLVPFLARADYTELQLLHAGIVDAYNLLGQVSGGSAEEITSSMARLNWCAGRVEQWQQQAIDRGVSRVIVLDEEEPPIFAKTA